MVLHCWLLLLLTYIQIAESFPQSREELEFKLRESRDSGELIPDKYNGFSLQPNYPVRYLGNDDREAPTVQNYYNQYSPGINQYGINHNDDMQRDVDMDKAIQEVFYPERPKIGGSGDITFPEFKLPISFKGTEFHKQKENYPSSFQNNEGYLQNSKLQSRYYPYFNRKPSRQNEVNNPSNNEIFKSILDLQDFDLQQISLKHAFLKKAETYNITETDDKKNFLLEKKVNVSKSLNYLNANNQLANFSDFHSSVLQEIMKKEHNNDYQTKNLFRNRHKDVAEEGQNGNIESHERLNLNDFVEGQFIDHEMPGGLYSRTQEPNKNHFMNNLGDESSDHDFVGGQFIGYSNKFLSKQRTPQNTDQHAIDVQPSDFVGGQFVGGPEVSEILGETNGETNAVTTMDMSSVTNYGMEPTDDEKTERYEDQTGNESDSLSILGMQHKQDDVDEVSKDKANQGTLPDKLNKIKSKQQDGTPILMGGSPKFNKGISQTLSIVRGIINEPGTNDQTTINVKIGNTELDTPQYKQTYSYSTTVDLQNTNSFNNEMTTTKTASNHPNSESLVYEDYNEDDNLGSIIDDSNNAKEQSDEIQGQPSYISSSFMATTKEAVSVVPLSGVSSEKDYYNTYDTSTQIVKDVYLYAGKDYKNNSLDERPENNEINSSSNKDQFLAAKETKENYVTEICFLLRNKKEVSLLDILSGDLYLENNGKKIALSLGKNPMKNCTSGTTECKLYLDVKNISQVLDHAHENEEENLIQRNKRHSKSNIFSLAEPQLKQTKSESCQNKTSLEYINGKMNLFSSTTSKPSQLTQEKEYPIKRDLSKNESKKESHNEYNQSTLLPTDGVTTYQSRTKRSSTGSDSCSCSTLFKSTQIPSYKYFVDKRLDILTNIVVAAKHFKDSR